VLTGFLILFCVFVLWPAGSWLQERLLSRPRPPTGSIDPTDDDMETLAELDILSDGRFDGRFGPER
jgi:hypothetical protein